MKNASLYISYSKMEKKKYFQYISILSAKIFTHGKSQPNTNVL